MTNVDTPTTSNTATIRTVRLSSLLVLDEAITTG